MNEIQFSDESRDISFFDIANFFCKNILLIVVFGVLGLLCAILFLSISAPKYEATAQIQTAQLFGNELLGFKTRDPVIKLNFKEPSALLLRLSNPNSFSKENFESCKLDPNSLDSGLALARMINASIPKGSTNIIEVKLHGHSPTGATACLQSIFDEVQESDNKITRLWISAISDIVEEKKVKLELIQSLITKSEGSGAGLVSYFSTRNDFLQINEDINAFNNLIKLSQFNSTQLISPIYASHNPTFPKKSKTIVLGLLLGILVGILIALLRIGIKKFQLTNKTSINNKNLI